MPLLLLGFDDEMLTAAQVTRVREAAPTMEVLQTRSEDEIAAAADQIEVAAGYFPRRLLPQMTRLRWFQQWDAGADWILDDPAARGRDFTLTNASGVHAIPISEHIFALLLAMGRRLPRALDAQRQGTWLTNEKQQRLSGQDPAEDPAPGLPTLRLDELSELAGQTMLLVGVGAIGARTARLAEAFEMRVLGVRRDPSKTVPGVERMHGPDRLSALFSEADVVVLTVPRTEATRGLVDRAALQRMKPTARVINIGRGGVVDEAALVQALDAGEIAGAALDVFEEEPLPADSPLWERKDILLTSHYSGLTPHYDERALAIFLENLARYQQDEPLQNVVDKEKGY